MKEHFEWVKRIIESCTDGFQLDVAQNVLELFAARYGKNELYKDLQVIYANKGTVMMVC